MNYYQQKEAEAAQKLAAVLDLPLPELSDHVGMGGSFDPWDLFPQLYGSYSSDFDDLAIDVLTEIRNKQSKRDDLAAHMFREMLCTSGLCDYGTSPRVCFATKALELRLDELIEKWKAYSQVQWADDN